jgi:hypothetical protein
MTRYIYLLSLLLSLTCLAACPHKTVESFQGDDKLMVERAKQIVLAINAFHQDTAEWPLTIRAAEANLTPGTQWPLNPYTQQPIAEVASPDFDPANSIGMVYSDKAVRDD